MALMAGCTAPGHARDPANYFLFNADKGSGLWRARWVDFEQVAKAYAARNKIPFSFEGTSAGLSVFQEDGALVARILFSSGFGSPFLAVDMAPSGKVIRHHTGVVTEGTPSQHEEHAAPANHGTGP